MNTKSLESRIAELLALSPEFAARSYTPPIHLTGDASTRQYFRLNFRDGTPQSAIVMVLSGVTHLIGGGDRNLSQDHTFVELALFFKQHRIPVPEIYIDGRALGLLLVEDVGEVGLWRYSLGDRGTEGASSELTLSLYRRAIDIIKSLQAIPFDKSCVAFQRTCSVEQYRREASEFIEYFIPETSLHNSPQIEKIRAFHEVVCDTVASHPKVLSHFDFMSFNLHVDSSGALRVLDFQEASLNSPARDLLALIDDRDVDLALGKERHAALLTYAARTLRDSDLLTHYHHYLLHWCFRVAGRFALLATTRGKPHYRNWIPGTLWRLGRALATKEAQAFPGAGAVLEIVADALPKVAEGASGVWPQLESR